MPSLEDARRFYAEEIHAHLGFDDEPLIEAFATVPREAFLGPGPWQILAPPQLGQEPAYRTTPDDDPRHLYHLVLVAIDAQRKLNNGHPASLALWIHHLAVRPGEHVVHIGAGVGYYTAILAQLTGATGRVTAIESDAALAERARANLSAYANVTVVHGDGTTWDAGAYDALFVNAGVTRVPAPWLERMNAGARLVVPMTASRVDESGAAHFGTMMLFRRDGEGVRVRAISPVAIFPCAGARDPESERELAQAMAGPRWRQVQRLRREPHEREESCVLHRDGFCLAI